MTIQRGSDTGAPTPSHSGEYAATLEDVAKELDDDAENISPLNGVQKGCSYPAMSMRNYARRIRLTLAAITRLERELDELGVAGQQLSLQLIADADAFAVLKRQRDAMREALEEVERRKPGVFPFIAAALRRRGRQ